jgi:hypothetical protein
VRWTDEQLLAFEKKTAEWRKEGTTRTHVLTGAEKPSRARSKYGNRKVVVDGEKFDSQKEAHRWGVLQLREKAKEIQNLDRQVRFDLRVNRVLICTYVADFTYEEAGKSVVEDCKGFRTEIYKIKKKMMKALRGIDLLET